MEKDNPVKNSEERFDTLAVKKGYIGPNQLLEALEIQVTENITKRSHRFVGEILIDLGYMTKTQVKDVPYTITTLRKRSE